MAYDVKVLDQPAQPTAVIRDRATLQDIAQKIGVVLGEIWQVPESARPGKFGRNIVLYHGCLPSGCEIEIGVEVPAPFTGMGRIECSSLPGGKVATTTHFGPYHEVGAAHTAIADWVRAQGHELAGPSWEVYGHWQEEWQAHPERIRTDVYYLLK